jgi:parvulin-like peptidyl-prolyl isomerase
MSKSPSRAAARKKAEEILARLLHDEDFDAIAKSSSDGPTASKGGLYVDMQPGSYGIPVVNDALNQLPVGQVSQILEAPNSFHIVRVDSRREKGPLRFDEVQDKVRNQVLEQNYQEAVEAFIAKLRAKTLVRTMFDNTESDPAIARRRDASVQAASNSAPNP